MKKNNYLFLILLVTCNLIAQNPFVKKIENRSDLDIRELINKNKFYYGTSNVCIYAGIKTYDDKKPYSYFELNVFETPRTNIYISLDGYSDRIRDNYGVGNYGSRDGFTYKIYEMENLNIYAEDYQFKKYQFKNFTFYYDENYIYLRGYDDDKYIEFVSLLTDYKGINKPLSTTKYFLTYDFDYVSYIKEYVQTKINKWLQKGEFEKMADYTLRVTEKEINKETQKYQQEALALLKKYFWKFVGEKSTFKLNAYDSENETFIVNSELFGDLAIKVSIDKAPSFKNNFSTVKFKNPEFILSDNKLILTDLDFEIDSNTHWTYNLSEKLKYTNTTIDYNFDKIDINVAQSSINKPETTIENKTISVGKSSVDVNIPENAKVVNRYALIIGNEDYQSMQRTLNSEQNVAFAVNDATIFRDYAIKTLGIEQENITFLTNATAGQMSQQIEKVCKMLNKLGEKAELVVYYAGHGYPDEKTKIPYLIPVDVSASNLEFGIKLYDFYKKLSETNAKKIIIFLDACFTGGGRDSGLLASRGIKVVPKEDALNGNIVVFSASSSLQSALPYQKEKHGIFSYYLFKKLQETNGNVALGSLYTYLRDNVSLQSLKINNKEQDPSINFSSTIEKEYSNWNLKN